MDHLWPDESYHTFVYLQKQPQWQKTYNALNLAIFVCVHRLQPAQGFVYIQRGPAFQINKSGKLFQTAPLRATSFYVWFHTLQTFSHLKVRRNSPALFSETLKHHQWYRSRRCCAPPAPSSRSGLPQGWSRLPPRSLQHFCPSTAGSAASPATPDRTVCASAASASPSELWRCPDPPRLPPWSHRQTLENPSVRQQGEVRLSATGPKLLFRRRSGGSDRPSCRGGEERRIY